MSDAETMPARYRPDPWIDSQVTRSGGRAGVRVPRIMLRDWLGLDGGDGVGFAPCDADSVWLGQTVPRFFGGKEATERQCGVPQLYLPAAAVDYLDVAPGATLRYHTPDARGRVRVEVAARVLRDADSEVSL